ncbi:MAG: OsmC family protein [Rhodospirillales bacterium]|nr:OsmC family protein [Rhodospirillales bacterium]
MPEQHRSRKVQFRGAFGDELSARLETPAGPVLGYGLFAHCFTCSKDVFAASRICAGLARRGIAVLRFDFTGLGSSEGDFANTNFSSNVDDLVAAADYLRKDCGAPALLIGHSLGGAAVLAAAQRIPDARAVVTIGAPVDPAHVMHHLKAASAEIQASGEAEVSISGRSFRIKKQFLDDISEQNLRAAIPGLKRALLIFHGVRDEVVGIENAAEIFLAARHPKSFVSLDNADHMLTRREDSAYVADVISAWVSRYFNPSDEITKTDLLAKPGTVLVRENRAGKFKADVSVGGKHTLRADEPASYGGDDTGPTPYDLLLAGLGACTSMTLRMYADANEWPLERVSVELKHEKIHAKDCEACETKGGKIDRIVRRVTMAGSLSDKQREKLLAIADKCPVHRTLHSEVSIETMEVSEG